MSAKKIQHESLVAIDLKMMNEKKSLIQMCFSVFSNWPLIVIFGVFYLNPFRYQFSVHSFFQSNDQIIIWSYGENFLLGFLFFAILDHILSFEILWLTVIGWLISNGEIHVLISVGACAGVLFSEARQNLKLISIFQGRTKKIWTYFSLIQMLCVFIAAATNYIFYMNLKNFGFFSATTTIHRFEFFILSVMFHYIVQLILLSVWGHFYSRRKERLAETSSVGSHKPYMTTTIFEKLNLSRDFKNKLKLFENSLKI